MCYLLLDNIQNIMKTEYLIMDYVYQVEYMSTKVMYAQYCDISVCHQSLSLAIVFTKIRSLCIVKLFPLFCHKVYFISYSLHRCFRVYLQKQQTRHKQQIKIHFEKIIECVFSKPRQFQIDIQITFLKSFPIH